MTDKKADKAKTGGQDTGQAQVQDSLDEAQAKGYHGYEVDQTPNENYTVDGVTSGKPTPETDPKQAEKAVRA